MTNLLFKLPPKTENAYKQTIKLFTTLSNDNFFSNSITAITFLVVKKYLSVIVSVDESKIKFVSGLFNTYFKNCEIIRVGDYSTQPVEYFELYKTRGIYRQTKTMDQLNEDLFGLIISSIQNEINGFCGITIFLRFPSKSLIDVLPITLGEFIAYDYITKTDSKIAFSKLIVFSDLEINQLSSLFSTCLKKIKIKGVNSWKFGKTNKGNLYNIIQKTDFIRRNFYPISEIFTIAHIPDSNHMDFSYVDTNSRKLIPPSKEVINKMENSSNLTPIGVTNLLGYNNKIGITSEDRLRHIYIIGKSGTGKTKLMQNMVLADIKDGIPCIFIDPHGKTALEILELIPIEYVDKVIYFDPSDKNNHIGFNPMEISDTTNYQTFVDNIISIFEKSLGSEWKPSLEYLLRQSIFALIEFGQPTIPNLIKLIQDKDFRRIVVDKCHTTVLQNFWKNTFLSFQDSNTDDVFKLINKLTQLISNESVLACISQSKSGFLIDNIIREKKVLVVNLSVGNLGEWVSSFLGSILITKVWQAVTNQQEDSNDNNNNIINTYMYVDEFQHFATESFISIFSEARKFKLGLTVANQYSQQIPIEIRKSLFGNIGTFISFQLGSIDADVISTEFAPEVTKEDLLNLNQREIYIKAYIDGITTRPFSCRTLTIDKPVTNYLQQILSNSKRLGKTNEQLREKNTFFF